MNFDKLYEESTGVLLNARTEISSHGRQRLDNGIFIGFDCIWPSPTELRDGGPTRGNDVSQASNDNLKPRLNQLFPFSQEN